MSDSPESGRRVRRRLVRLSDTPQAFDDYELRKALEVSQRVTFRCKTWRNLKQAPVFRPTMEEFRDPSSYISSITEIGQQYGICKIIPPPEWTPPNFALSNLSSSFPTRKQLLHKITEGVCFAEGKDYFLSDYQRMAEESKKRIFGLFGKDENVSVCPSDLEDMFWDLIDRVVPEDVCVEYGADLDSKKFGSGFPKDFSSPWSLQTLPLLDSFLLKHLGAKIGGVIVPWIYFGSIFTTFCWHNEDLFLPSINYLHTGAPKHWYAVPGNQGNIFYKFLRHRLCGLFRGEPDKLFQLTTLFSLSELSDSVDFEVCKVTQNPGSFIITFSEAYHAGFNMGYNCAEAVNFAPPLWLPHGLRAARFYESFRNKKQVFCLDKLLLRVALNEKNPSILEKILPVLESIVAEERQTRNNLRNVGVVVRNLAGASEDISVDAILKRTERECAICNRFCFFSEIRCSCEGMEHSDRARCSIHWDHLCGCVSPSKRLVARVALSNLFDVIKECHNKIDKAKKESNLLTLENRSLPTIKSETVTTPRIKNEVPLNITETEPKIEFSLTIEPSTTENTKASSPYEEKTLIEVLADDENTFYPASIIHSSTKNDADVLTIRYDSILDDASEKALVKQVPTKLIRPRPSKPARSWSPKIAEVIDAFSNDGWHRGVVRQICAGLGFLVQLKSTDNHSLMFFSLKFCRPGYDWDIKTSSWKGGTML